MASARSPQADEIEDVGDGPKRIWLSIALPQPLGDRFYSYLRQPTRDKNMLENMLCREALSLVLRSEFDWMYHIDATLSAYPSMSTSSPSHPSPTDAQPSAYDVRPHKDHYRPTPLQTGMQAQPGDVSTAVVSDDAGEGSEKGSSASLSHSTSMATLLSAVDPVPSPTALSRASNEEDFAPLSMDEEEGLPAQDIETSQLLSVLSELPGEKFSGPPAIPSRTVEYATQLSAQKECRLKEQKAQRQQRQALEESVQAMEAPAEEASAWGRGRRKRGGKRRGYLGDDWESDMEYEYPAVVKKRRDGAEEKGPGIEDRKKKSQIPSVIFPRDDDVLDHLRSAAGSGLSGHAGSAEPSHEEEPDQPKRRKGAMLTGEARPRKRERPGRMTEDSVGSAALAEILQIRPMPVPGGNLPFRSNRLCRLPDCTNRYRSPGYLCESHGGGRCQAEDCHKLHQGRQGLPDYFFCRHHRKLYAELSAWAGQRKGQQEVTGDIPLAASGPIRCPWSLSTQDEQFGELVQ